MLLINQYTRMFTIPLLLYTHIISYMFVAVFCIAGIRGS